MRSYTLISPFLLIFTAFFFACRNPIPPSDADADLADITLSAGELTPEFSRSIAHYTVDLLSDVASIVATGIPEDAGAVVGGDSGVAVALSTGDNLLTLSATAASDRNTDFLAEYGGDTPQCHRETIVADTDTLMTLPITPPAGADEQAVIRFRPSADPVTHFAEACEMDISDVEITAD